MRVVRVLGWRRDLRQILISTSWPLLPSASSVPLRFKGFGFIRENPRESAVTSLHSGKLRRMIFT